MKPSWKLLQAVCNACGRNAGLVLIRECTVLDHGDDASGCCNNEEMWPCSVRCAEELAMRDGGRSYVDMRGGRP